MLDKVTNFNDSELFKIDSGDEDNMSTDAHLITSADAGAKPVTIFVVDDDDVDVMGIERALKKLKIVNPVIRAKDGLEGLTMLQDGHVPKPYLILLDINMPRMNGISMLSEMRADKKLSDSVVFILTTSNSPEDKMSAYRDHVAGYIVKKQERDALLGVMDMLGTYWKTVELPVADS